MILVVVTIALHLALSLPTLALCGLLDAGDDAAPSDPRGRLCVGERENAALLVATFFAGLHLLWVACMAAMHSTLVCHDQTTYESIRGGQGTAAPPSAANCERALCAHRLRDAPPPPPPDAAGVELV